MRGCFSSILIRFALAFAFTSSPVFGVVAVCPLVRLVFALLFSFPEPVDQFVHEANAFSVVPFKGIFLDFVVAGQW